jgi:hypothetical protein
MYCTDQMSVHARVLGERQSGEWRVSGLHVVRVTSRCMVLPLNMIGKHDTTRRTVDPLVNPSTEIVVRTASSVTIPSRHRITCQLPPADADIKSRDKLCSPPPANCLKLASDTAKYIIQYAQCLPRSSFLAWILGCQELDGVYESCIVMCWHQAGRVLASETRSHKLNFGGVSPDSLQNQTRFQF